MRDWDACKGRASRGEASVAAGVLSLPGVGLSNEQQQAAAARRRMKRCLRPKQLGTLAEARRYDQSWNRAQFTPQYHEVL